MNISKYYLLLSSLITEAIDEQGKWNGKEPGREERQADVANEIKNKAQELQELLEQYEQA